MQPGVLIFLGGLLAALAVGLGAIGAHALKEHLTLWYKTSTFTSGAFLANPSCVLRCPVACSCPGQEYMAVSHRRLFSRFVRSRSFAVPYTPPIRRLKSLPYWAFAFCQPRLNLFCWYGPSLASVEWASQYPAGRSSGRQG